MNFRHRALLLLLLTASGAPAREPDPPPPPPLPLGVNLSVYRGESLTITLRALGRAPTDLKFLIRTKPQHGTLGRVYQTGLKTAMVTYTHDDSGPGFDSFTYAVQGIDTAVSASAEVGITISEEPPAFEVVPVLDFGDMLVGETEERTFVIANKGGGRINGTILTQPPWRVLGPAAYSLGRREEALVRIAFAPTQAGPYEDPLGFSHATRTLLTLSGSARAPFSFEPPEVQLGGLEAPKSARVRIRNLTNHRRTLALRGPIGVTIPESASLAAGAETTITVGITSGFKSALTDTITIESGGFRHDLRVKIFSADPSLSAEPSAGIHFGEVNGPQRRAAALVIRNDGGSAARLRAILPDGLLLIPDPSSVVLEAGQSRAFDIALDSTRPGDLNADIVIEAVGSAPVRVPVTWRRADKSDATTPKIATSSLIQKPQALPAVPAPETRTSVGPVKVLSVGQHHIEFGWRRQTDTTGQRIEARQIRATQKGPPRIEWTEWKGAQFSTREDSSIARLERLPAGSVWHLRIRTSRSGGAPDLLSETIRVETLPGKNFSIPWWLWIAAVLAIMLPIVRIWERRRNQAARADDDRLSRIEEGK